MNPDFSSLEDAVLLELSAKNNQAFEALFERYWKRLYTYAYKIYQEPEVCEDIVQEVFVSLWHKNKTSRILNLEAYLLKAVKYKIANHIRDLKFSTTHLEHLEQVAATATAGIEYQELEHTLLTRIELLPKKCKEVFKLSRLEHKSNKEIAQLLNLSIRTVETHISNALNFLRQDSGILEISLFIFLMFL